mmetsp:Transcript_47539/g.152731  ORF Transcript_47539/g.152731 Transcript_47539/m.152731 type:complete len:350 (-) Transcript_47539:527-1576(-)
MRALPAPHLLGRGHGRCLADDVLDGARAPVLQLRFPDRGLVLLPELPLPLPLLAHPPQQLRRTLPDGHMHELHLLCLLGEAQLPLLRLPPRPLLLLLTRPLLPRSMLPDAALGAPQLRRDPRLCLGLAALAALGGGGLLGALSGLPLLLIDASPSARQLLLGAALLLLLARALLLGIARALLLALRPVLQLPPPLLLQPLAPARLELAVSLPGLELLLAAGAVLGSLLRNLLPLLRLILPAPELLDVLQPLAVDLLLLPPPLLLLLLPLLLLQLLASPALAQPLPRGGLRRKVGLQGRGRRRGGLGRLCSQDQGGHRRVDLDDARSLDALLEAFVRTVLDCVGPTSAML